MIRIERGVARTADAVTVHLTGGGKFAPTPVRTKAGLTPRRAWAKYVKVDTSYRGVAMPQNVRLGHLTLPIGRVGPGGTEKYQARNELVYGYSWHRCPQSQGPSGSKVPPNPCIEWNFFSAGTGRQIVQTWQAYR